MRRGVSWAEDLTETISTPPPDDDGVKNDFVNDDVNDEDDEDEKHHQIRDENFTFAMTVSQLETAVRDENDSVQRNVERLARRKECERLMENLFELLKREILATRRSTSRRRRSSSSTSVRLLHAEVHNYASNVSAFQKCLKLWKKKEMHMVKQLEDGENGKLFATKTTPQKTAASPLKKLFVTRAEETDGLLREVEEKLEMLRVLSSGTTTESNHDLMKGDVENGGATINTKPPQRKFTFAARQNITARQKRTNQKVLVCVVGILFFALFVATFAWLWTNEAEPWIEKSIRENREHLTYEEIVYQPIDRSNNFDS